MSYHLVQNKIMKFLRSSEVNYNFNKVTGYLERWGRTKEEDPVYAPFPEILDIEVTSICAGPDNKNCSFCYKANTTNGYNMPLEDFKNIIDKMPFLTQVALGADAHGTTNPHLFDMMAYARSKEVIPNLTIAQVSPEVAKKLVEVAGAVAVSVYPHAGVDIAYDSVKNLTEASMEWTKLVRVQGKVQRLQLVDINKLQDYEIITLKDFMEDLTPEGKIQAYREFGTAINFHFMIAAKTIETAYDILKDMESDPRIQFVNAIVFLSLKQKRRGVKFEYVTQEQYKQLVDYCLANNVRFGFDSCSAPSFLNAVKDHQDYHKFKTYSEDCESTLFSSYISCDSKFYPCSFTEGSGNWEDGLLVDKHTDFIKDIWFNERTVEFRNTLLNNTDSLGCRNCPAFAICGIDRITDAFKKSDISGDTYTISL